MYAGVIQGREDDAPESIGCYVLSQYFTDLNFVFVVESCSPLHPSFRVLSIVSPH